jgi:predicted AlkP superfamily pyrophosphatase or phosphodiesterase
MHYHFTITANMRHIFLLCCSIIAITALAQKKVTNTVTSKPKLVVGIVVDQMRWDFLYRYKARYGNGGFNRLVDKGFTCENAFIPYTPTVTAAGHACVYTGSVPAIHGITGNAWYDNVQQRNVYCSEDLSVLPIGSDNAVNGKMSPKNMLTTTIGDELRLATNFKSKVIGIALKDRGSILPAGHSANAAFWYDVNNGKWITSTYYSKELPTWVQQFNNEKWPEKYMQQGWNTLYPISTYTNSTADAKPYENKPFGKEQAGFPYVFKSGFGGLYSTIATTPYGNSMTMELAKLAVQNEQLGKGNTTDMLCVSFSSTDYVGHSFGPNSIETEDTYLRLDKDIETFLNFLDAQVGNGNYTVFLSADHGVAHVPGFMEENKLPGAAINDNDLQKRLNALLKEKYKADKIIVSTYNYQLTLNHPVMDSLQIDSEAIIDYIIKQVQKEKGISQVFAVDDMNETPLPSKIRTMLNNGYYKKRSGDIQLVFTPGFIDGGKTGTTHGLWAPYDSHIPIVFYGWGIKQGKSYKEVYMTDIAATITALLQIQMPSGCIGEVVAEAIR